MTAKASTQQKAQPRRRSQDEIQILEYDAGAYYLIRNAILQNKRLVDAIVHRWLRDNGYVLMLREEADATTDPRLQAMIEKAEAQVAAARAEIEQWENELMDLVRSKKGESDA